MADLETITARPEQTGPNLSEGLTGGVRYQFTEDSFEEALQTFGPENLAAALTQRASSLLPPEYRFTYESLKSGEDPILDQMPKFQELSVEERQRYFNNPEAFFELFSNVEDYGKYDPSRFDASKDQPQKNTFMETVAEEFARKIPTGIGMSEGLLFGAARAKDIARNIPIRSPKDLLLRLGIYGGGALAGAAGGAEIGEQFSEMFFGPRKAISPSLQAYQNFAETAALTINPSSFSQPFRWSTDKNWLGASSFLQNFKNVNKNWPGYKGAVDYTALSANLSNQQLKKALNAKTREGLAGKVLPDSTKGPISARALSTLEQLIPNARAYANNHPFLTVGLDFGSGLGAATGASVAETMNPGSEGTRFLFELIGGGAPGPLVEGGVRLTVGAKNRILPALRKYYTDKEEAVTTAKEKAAMRTILAGLRSAEVNDVGIELLNDLLKAEAALIDEGVTEAKNVSLMALGAGSPSGPALANIDRMIGQTLDELSVSSKKGRDAWIQASKQKIIDFADSGDPELVKLSAILAKSVFEEGLKNNIQIRTQNVFNALKKVTGGNPNKLKKYEVSELLYKRLDSFVKETYEQEKRFWQNVGNFEITEFRNKDGQTQDLPNMVSIFDRAWNNGGLRFASDTGNAGLWSNLPSGMTQDLTEIFRYFGRNLDGTPVEAADGPAATAPLSAAENEALESVSSKLEQLRSSLGGERRAELFEQDRQTLASLTTLDEKLSFLQTKADELRGFESTLPASDRVYAEALDRLVTLETVRAREAADNAFASGAMNPDDIENPVTADRLMEMRSELLTASANIKSGIGKRGNSVTAQKLDRLANAILQDLISQDTDSVPYNTARAFTLARRDLTQRTFLGDLDATDTLGRERLTADNMLEYMFKGGADAVVRRFDEIQRANIFMRDEMGLTTRQADRFAGNMNDAYKNAFRYITKKIMVDKPDPNNPEKLNKQVDLDKLKKFKEDPANAKLLSIFPEIARGLKTAEKAQIFMTKIDPEKFFKNDPQMQALNVVSEMGAETPQLTIAKMMGTNNPFRDLNFVLDNIRNQKKVTILKNGEVKETVKPRKTIFDAETNTSFSVEDAEQGLKKAILQYAIMRGGGDGLYQNPKRTFETLFTKPPKVSSRKNTLMEWMVSNNIMTKEDSTLIRQYLKEMINVEDAFSTGKVEDVMFKRPTMAKKTFIQMAGATLGQRSQESLNNILQKVGLGTQRGGIGGGLVAAQAGSEAAQDLFLVAPGMAMAKTMKEVMNNPKKFGHLLLEIQNEEQAKAAEATMAQMLTEFGFNQITKRDALILRPLLFPETEYERFDTAKPPVEKSDTEKLMEESRKKYQPTDEEASLNIPTQAPPLPVGPAPSPSFQLASASLPQTTPQSGPVDRTRYAAMFPNDSASALIRQGIGSMMG